MICILTATMGLLLFLAHFTMYGRPDHPQKGEATGQGTSSNQQYRAQNMDSFNQSNMVNNQVDVSGIALEMNQQRQPYDQEDKLDFNQSSNTKMLYD